MVIVRPPLSWLFNTTVSGKGAEDYLIVAKLAIQPIATDKAQHYPSAYKKHWGSGHFSSIDIGSILFVHYTITNDFTTYKTILPFPWTSISKHNLVA